MYTVDAIRKMNFSEVVGLVNEPNMPSGGAATVRRVLQQIPLGATDNVLEIGSNTGFTCIEMASWAPAAVYGVDINPNSVALARAKAVRTGVTNVTFMEGTALALPFPDQHFQLVFCSNVTSFITDRHKAVNEYYRVLRPRGVLAAAPIYYHQPPPEELRREVEIAVGAPIPVRGKDYWRELFAHPRGNLFFDEDYEYVHQLDDQIDRYITMVMSQAPIQHLPAQNQEVLIDRLRYFYQLFNENLRYARYCILLYQLDAPNCEPILYQSRPIVAHLS